VTDWHNLAATNENAVADENAVRGCADFWSFNFGMMAEMQFWRETQ
jgi:hypothetical protein